MERYNTGSACVIPVILRPCLWSMAPFAKLQALPKDAKPIAEWANADEAFLDVASGIQRPAENLDDRQGRGGTIVTSQVDVKHWREMIANPTVADAIPDRRVHNAHRLNLAGECLRKRAVKRAGLDGNRPA